MPTEYFHEGSLYAMEPGYGSAMPTYMAGRIGLSTDARTANQIQEISKKLNVGARAIELAGVSADVFESIPDDHLTEVKRMSKLVGAEVTLHAPIVEPSGFTKDGWSESNRQMTERQMLQALERARKLNVSGMPVTFHASAGVPEGIVKEMEGEGKARHETKKAFAIVDPQTGEYGALKPREEYLEKPEEKAKEFNPEEELARQNKEIWAKTLNEVAFYADRGIDEMSVGLSRLSRQHPERGILENQGILPKEKGEETEDDLIKAYGIIRKKREEIDKLAKKAEDPNVKAVAEMAKDAARRVDHAEIFMEDSYNHLRNLFNRVYKDAKPEDKEKLKQYAEKVQAELPNIRKDPAKIKEFSGIIDDGISILKGVTPQIYKPFTEFVTEKSAQTFGNVAWQAYKSAKPEERANLPVISIENPPVGGFGGRAEELTKLVAASREAFVKNAVDSKTMSKGEAEKKAEQLIGATWDVGHINMLKKYGYNDEELRKQTEKIAPMVKNVHLSDNFGMEHTELPMGMGNVPLDKMLKELEKAKVNPNKIVEAINWYQHFKTVPFKETMAGLKQTVSPAAGSPYWSKAAGMYGNYSAGYGTIFPEEHVSMYGAGFSGLPTELGGQVQGRQSRFSGTPTD